MRPGTSTVSLLVLVALLSTGCQNSRVAGGGNQSLGAQPQAEQAYLVQNQELQRRADQLDTNNRDLHAHLAQADRQTQLLRDEVQLLRDRVGETADLLAKAQLAREEAESSFRMLQASTSRRGSATITANSSLRTELPVISVPGVEVRRDGDVVRMEIPVDKIFVPESATLHQAAIAVLGPVADAVQTEFPRQVVGIEGHGDNQLVGNAQWRNAHHLTTAQAVAVFEHLVTHERISPRRLFVLGHGGNHPLVSNATSDGQSKNRRVELVVYPERIE